MVENPIHAAVPCFGRLFARPRVPRLLPSETTMVSIASSHGTLVRTTEYRTPSTQPRSVSAENSPGIHPPPCAAKSKCSVVQPTSATRAFSAYPTSRRNQVTSAPDSVP